MKAIKIQWNSEGEAGAWSSSEGRFSISGGGYRHGVTPDFYELRDEIAAKDYHVFIRTGGIPANYNGRQFHYVFDTVGECKQQALTICIAFVKSISI